MFDNQAISAIIAVARANNIEPAALLAVVEIESGGSPFEKDGVTPRFLFERHIFHRQLRARAPGRLNAAVQAGLAHPDWRKQTQYKDQGTVAGKLSLLGRARAIDEDCANRSCSWGLGQIMGFHAEDMGFSNATEMVRSLATGGLAAQIEVMVRFIKSKRLLSFLNAHDWDGFALRYNGKGYRANGYHTKLRDAYGRWVKRLRTSDFPVIDGPTPIAMTPALHQGASGDAVSGLQARLSQAGYDCGAIDGRFGPFTRDALLAFQADVGITPTGVADPATLQALAIAKPRPISTERQNETLDGLREKGSTVISLTDWVKRLAIAFGVVGGAGAISSGGGGLDTVLNVTPEGEAVATQVVPENAADVVTSLMTAVQGLLGSSGGIGVVVVIAAILLWRNANQIAYERLDDHRTGANLDK